MNGVPGAPGGGAAPVNGGAAPPIAVPTHRRTHTASGADDASRSLSSSWALGPHVITIQSSSKALRSPGPGESQCPSPTRSGVGGTPSRSPSRRVPCCSRDAESGAAVIANPVSDVEAPLLPGGSGSGPPRDDGGGAAALALRRKIAFAQGLSWIVNITLLIAKVYVYFLSGSKAVMASAADSTVDLISQVVISYTEWQMGRPDPSFPVGQARLEALGVLGCASIMAVASFEVLAEAGVTLYQGLEHGVIPQLELGVIMYTVLGVATALKLVCYIVCYALKSKSDSMMALAEDHINDVMSNLAAVGAAAATSAVAGGWWIDPVVAMVISAWILWRWFEIARTQVHKLVGRGAPPDFVEQLRQLADEHHDDLTVDVIRAYHFGARYLVEMEVVLPSTWTLPQSHDVALMLQHKVEALEVVERCFVHTDYVIRDYPEHKVERTLGLPASSGGSGSGVTTEYAARAITAITTISST